MTLDLFHRLSHIIRAIDYSQYTVRHWLVESLSHGVSQSKNQGLMEKK